MSILSKLMIGVFLTLEASAVILFLFKEIDARAFAFTSAVCMLGIVAQKLNIEYLRKTNRDTSQ